MAPRGRGQTEIRVRTTREAISPPAFLGANLTCLQNIYIGINGRRKYINKGSLDSFFKSG
jgi:hypothetical protein